MARIALKGHLSEIVDEIREDFWFFYCLFSAFTYLVAGSIVTFFVVLLWSHVINFMFGR